MSWSLIEPFVAFLDLKALLLTFVVARCEWLAGADIFASPPALNLNGRGIDARLEMVRERTLQQSCIELPGHTVGNCCQLLYGIDFGFSSKLSHYGKSTCRPPPAVRPLHSANPILAPPNFENSCGPCAEDPCLSFLSHILAQEMGPILAST